MHSVECEAPDQVKKAAQRGHINQKFFMFESTGELADYYEKNCRNTTSWSHPADNWVNHDSNQDVIRKCHTGDNDYVAASDALLAKYETVALETMRPQWENVMAGSRANVQAYIAGHPQAMQLRKRLPNAGSPIAIIVDISQSGTINLGQIRKRGIAILALTRALSARRPVELWIGSVFQCHRQHWATAIARIDTAPLDLASAAYTMCSASYTRRACYGIGQTVGFDGGWFLSPDFERKWMKDLFQPVFPHVDEMLCIPGMAISDASVNDPERWIDEKVAQYAPMLMGHDDEERV